jgi:competence protein ComEC
MFAHIPFVRYLIFLLSGILCSDLLFTPDRPGRLFLAFCLVLIVSSVLLVWRCGSAFRGIALFSTLFVLGGGVAGWKAKQLQSRIASVENQSYDSYQLQVRSLPEKRERSWRYEVAVERLLDGETVTVVDSKALLYLPSDWKTIPSVGDRLLVRGKLRRPDTATSAFSFDYRLFLERKGIPWIAYVNNPDRIYTLPIEGKKSLFERLMRLSESSQALFRKYITDDDSYGLVKAMILGRRDDIRSDLNTAFVNSGTVHILSVSGLHIAIFFSVLHFLFSPLKRSTWGKLFYLLIMSAILILYAIMTGLPASVQRATFMCIVWMLASTFARKQSPVNSLALSAFVLLLADPNAFFDVGFQLSFLAMLGIFLLAAPIASLYKPKNRIVQHLWSITIMSVTAQLMTFPLVTYYFNQFPSYFLIANLLAVDLAGLLIPVSFIFLTGGLLGIEWITIISGHALNYLAMLVNVIVEVPQSLPGYLIRDLHLNLMECLALLASILIVYGATRSRNPRWVSGLFALALCFSFYSSSLIVTDYRTEFVRPLGEKSAVLYKMRGRMLVVYAPTDKEASLPISAQRELTKYIARYGSDTTIVSLSSRY